MEKNTNRNANRMQTTLTLARERVSRLTAYRLPIFRILYESCRTQSVRAVEESIPAAGLSVTNRFHDLELELLPGIAAGADAGATPSCRADHVEIHANRLRLRPWSACAGGSFRHRQSGWRLPAGARRRRAAGSARAGTAVAARRAARHFRIAVIARCSAASASARSPPHCRMRKAIRRH
jgi:hypothetical protein